MNGYQLTFFTQQDRRHHGQSLGHWLVEAAQKMGIRGATLIAAAEGFGHRGRFHSAHFFELADQPLEVVMAVTEDESNRLFEKLREERVKLFYIKALIEFGALGEE